MTNYARGGVLARFFSGICECVFESRLGLADPPLIDYLSDLMIRFARLDSVHRVRNLTGRPVLEVADMLTEAENRVGLARRDVHRHIGDVTLFWTGVYPESLTGAVGYLPELSESPSDNKADVAYHAAFRKQLTQANQMWVCQTRKQR